METKETWRELVKRANEDIKQFNKEIAVMGHVNDDLYGIDILTLNNDGCENAVEFAENYREDELVGIIHEAWEYIYDCLSFNEQHEEYVCYRKVNGWTHGLPALIQSITEIPLFFFDEHQGTTELVEDDIDAYETRDGYFCVLPDDYAIALRQIDDHDNRGVEH